MKDEDKEEFSVAIKILVVLGVLVAIIVYNKFIIAFAKTILGF